jgi:hypothetical protein
MRAEASYSDAIRAIAKAIEAKFSQGDWLELGLITDTHDVIRRHPRLLRSLDWGDPDYHGNVLATVPVVLGDRGVGRSAVERFANLSEVEEFVGLQAWLEGNDPSLYERLYAGEDAVVLDSLHSAAQDLGIPDVAMHVARIRRGLHDDPAQAIGSSKELLETVLKAILGLHGTGPETKLDIPQLVKRAHVALGLDAAGVRGTDPEATYRRKMLGSLATIVHNAAELRNAGFGTGHGISHAPELDAPTARLVVNAAAAVATFYIEAHAASAD